MEAFVACVKRMQSLELKVLIDFVPNHTAREYRPGNTPNPADGDTQDTGFNPNNFYFYLNGRLNLPFAPEYFESPAKATGNDAFSTSPTKNDWYETVKINYGQDPRTGQSDFEPMPRTWAFMTSVLQHWAALGVDGFRCDMVDMVPNTFWKHAISTLKGRFPALMFVGESYTPTNYQPLIEAGFDLLYDKVGLYDAIKDRLLGKGSVGKIGKALWETRIYQDHLLRFTENHDEPRLPSKQMFGKTAPALAMFFLTAAVGKHVMLYAGQEFGEKAEGVEGFSGDDGKTTIFDYWSVGTLRRFYNKGKWDGGGLAPGEKILRGHYLTIMLFHNLLQAEKLHTIYNLQTANPTGYGAADLEDGFAVLLSGKDSRPVLAVTNFTARLERFTVRIPAEAFRISGQPVVGEEIVHISDARTDAEAVSLGADGFKVSVTLGAYGCLAVRLSFRP